MPVQAPSPKSQIAEVAPRSTEWEGVSLATLLLSCVVVASDQGSAAEGPSLPQFVSALQQAVARNNRPAVAAMMRYPLTVTAGGLQIPASDAKAFVSLYDTVMSPALRQVIGRARVPAEGKPAAAAVRSAGGGITFENAVTIAPVGSGFRVTSLTVPMAPQSKSPGEPIERQLTFRVGQPTQLSGTLTPGGRDRFVFYAVRGALVDARLSGIPGRSALLRVVEASPGKAVDVRADAGTRVWTGRVSADGSYRIEVVRQPDTGNEPMIYTLSVGAEMTGRQARARRLREPDRHGVRRAWRPPPADLLLHNGRVITIDGSFTIHEAVAITGDRIIAVGGNAASAGCRAPGRGHRSARTSANSRPDGQPPPQRRRRPRRGPLARPIARRTVRRHSRTRRRHPAR